MTSISRILHTPGLHGRHQWAVDPSEEESGEEPGGIVPCPWSEPEFAASGGLNGPTHEPTELLRIRDREPWSHLKPNHVECICQSIHAGVFIPCLSGRKWCEPNTPAFQRQEHARPTLPGPRDPPLTSRKTLTTARPSGAEAASPKVLYFLAFQCTRCSWRSKNRPDQGLAPWGQRDSEPGFLHSYLTSAPLQGRLLNFPGLGSWGPGEPQRDPVSIYPGLGPTLP